MKKSIVLLLLGLFMAPPALAAAPSATMGKIAAVVNGERITALDIEKMARPAIARRGLVPNNPEHRGQIDEIYKQALDAQINDILLHQEAVRLKTEVPESDVDKEVTRLLQLRKISAEELEKQLKQEGVDMKKLRDQIRKGLLRQRLMSSMITRKGILTKEEIAKYYEENKESFRVISEVRMAILIYPPDFNPEPVAQRVMSGKLSFEDAVRQYSIDPATKQNNGAMPPKPWKEMSPEWRARVSAMKPGDVSELFIIPHPQFQLRAQAKLLEKISEDKVLSLSEATPEIESVLREPLMKARFEEFVQGLRSRALIDIKGL
jgi:peptidyl-prolyl cis-trans isomerase SurA